MKKNTSELERKEYLLGIEKTEYLIELNKLSTILIRLNGLINIDGLNIDITKYANRKAEIEKNVSEFENNPDSKLSYSKFKEDIENLINEINNEYKGLYIVHLYTISINEILNETDETNIDELVNQIDKLIDCLKDLNDEEKNSDIANKAYELIYNSILNEAVLDRENILNNIKYGDSTIKEKITNLVVKGLGELPRSESANIELKHLDEGLGYDYLDSDLVKKLAALTLEDKKQYYETRKQSATMEVMEKIDNLRKEKAEIDKEKKNRRLKIRSIRRSSISTYAKLISVILVPVLFAAGGVLFSIKFGRQANAKAITYDYKTNKQLQQADKLVTGRLYTAKYEIKKCTPWRENPNGKGYIRDVEYYSYLYFDKKAEMSIEDIITMENNKKVEHEKKSVLFEDDITDRDQIIVTEIIPDIDNSIPSPLLMIVLVLLFSFMGVLVTAGLSNLLDVDTPIEDIKKFKDELKNVVKWQVIKEEYINIGNKIVKVQEECKDVEDRFAGVETEITPELIETVKKYVHK
jgi:hypothetical protein